MADRFPKIPKVRERAIIVLADGRELHGHVFIEATSRIQDLLNDPLPYFAFVQEDGTVILINKGHVVHVTPYD